MYKRKVILSEENDYLGLLQTTVQEDYDVIKGVQFNIDFIYGYNQLIVLVAGLPSVKAKVDEFADHLVKDYK